MLLTFQVVFRKVDVPATPASLSMVLLPRKLLARLRAARKPGQGQSLWSRIALIFACGAPLICFLPVKAEINAARVNSLGTVVEKSASDGTVLIKNGTVRGQNRFHRFKDFDTRDQDITRVVFDNPGTPNVLIGVLNRTFLNKPIALAEVGNFYVLSPMGITLGGGVSFTNVDNLMLSTAAKFQLGSSFFDYNSAVDLSSPDFEALPSARPGEILSGHLLEGDATAFGMFESAAAGAGLASIELEKDVTFSVDQSILIAANNAPIQITGADLSAFGRDEGQGLFVVGRSISVGEGTTLRANKQLVLREPSPVGQVGDSISLSSSDFLASPVVSSNCATAGGAVACNTLDLPQLNRTDTLSSLSVKDSTLTSAGHPSEDWDVLLRVTGWGCRDGEVQCSEGPQVAPNGVSYDQLGIVSPGPSNPGRRAFTGLDVDNLVINPEIGVSNLNVTLGTDWGVVRSLQLDSPSGLTSRAFKMQQANGSPIKPGDGLVKVEAERLGHDFTGLDDDQVAIKLNDLKLNDPDVAEYAEGWEKGKISDLGESANDNVSYDGDWWDGGDATFNNIRIGLITPTPVPTPTPPPSSPSSGAVESSVDNASTPEAIFERVEIQNDQNIFSDSDSTSMNSVASSSTQLLGIDLTLDISGLSGSIDPSSAPDSGDTSDDEKSKDK